MKKTSVAAAIIGNIVEWYDFTLYIFLAPVLAHHFFSSNNPVNGLLLTFMIFAIGFFIRPLGSLLFGHLGDHIGRASALKISLLLISIATLGIGLMPSYQSWGIYSSLCFVGFRLLQGISIGGEFAGSMIYLTEMAPATKRAWLSCMANNGSNLGVLCATLMAACIANIMLPDDFYYYGWRLPFILGGFLGFVGLGLRFYIIETPVFETLQKQNGLVKLPLFEIIHTYKKNVLVIFLCVVMSATGSYVLMSFMSTYLPMYYHFTLAKALQIQAFYSALTFLLVSVAAKLSDHYGRRVMLSIAALGYLTCSLPCFLLLKMSGLGVFLLPLVVFYCIEQANTPAAMVEYFPAKARFSGISLGYNLSMALVGGTAPLINTWLIARLSNPLIIAYYLMAGAAITLMIIRVCLPKPFGKQLNLVC